jgi:hypothetical protein
MASADGAEAKQCWLADSWFPALPHARHKVAFATMDCFKMNDQGTRVKTRRWEDAGLVKQDGAMPCDIGGKPGFRYIVADPRVKRIIKNKLDAIVAAEIEEA